SHNNYQRFDLFNLDNIDSAFEQVKQLKYLQSVNVGINSNIKVIPMPSGHMIGGTMWRVILPNGQNIVYSLDCNHKSEYHLDPGSLSSITFKPYLLITNALYSHTYSTYGSSQKISRKNSEHKMI
ncbi:MAG: cleavage and polyadenylation specificity factor subunit 2, partial [Paramarteilia canceri]